jgi:hypothetical protein
MAKKKKTSSKPKPQINVRMDRDLYDLIHADAAAGERKAPAQVRMVLKAHYRGRLKKT